MEIWKSLEWLEDYSHYEVSNYGNVRHTELMLIRKPVLSHGGYPEVRLSRTKKIQKAFSIHRLVAMAFIPNPCNYPEINHIDNDKTNNAVENLEWCTRKTNMSKERGGKSTYESFTLLTDKQRLHIALQLGVGISQRRIMQETGLSYQKIHRVKQQLEAQMIDLQTGAVIYDSEHKRRIWKTKREVDSGKNKKAQEATNNRASRKGRSKATLAKVADLQGPKANSKDKWKVLLSKLR